MNTSKLSKAELEKLVEQLAGQLKQQSSDLQVRLTSATNLYIRTSKFQAWSENKSKYYTYGLNINYEVAKVLFNDPELLAEIKDRINSIQ